MAENDDARKFDVITDYLGDMREVAYSVVDMKTLAQALLLFQKAKDKRYQRSWAKHGLIGYWAGNLDRQVDRVDPNFMCLFESGCIENVKEIDVLHVLDTLTDMGLYSLMGICLMAAYWPEFFKTFMERVEAEINGG